MVVIQIFLLAFFYWTVDAYAEGFKDLILCELVFSDQDLEKYGKSQDAQTEPAVPGSEDTRRISGEEREKATEENKRKGEEKQKERWCNRGNKLRRKIEKLRLNVQGREREIAGMSIITFREITRKEKAQKDLERGYKRRLMDAEQSLTDAENEAYRKHIPMGWLRCQF